MDLQDKHSEELYKKLCNRFDKIVMMGANDSTLDRTKAKVFNMMFVKGDPSTMVSVSILDPKNLQLYFDQKMVAKFDKTTKNRWFQFIRSMRQFVIGKPEITFNTVEWPTPGLSNKDIAAMIKSNKENVNESKYGRLFGSKRSSYQLLEKVKIKVRHSRVVNDDVHGSRSRNIKALFLETQLGERFRFPFVSLEGVRAMGRHLEEGGDWNDRLGQHILETTSNLITIKNFVREVRRQKITNENLIPLLEQLKEKKDHYKRNLYLMSGSKGYHSYKENISETYVTPVESIAGHFSSVDPSIQQYLPAIERIIGEQETNTIEDQIIAEHVSWIEKSTLIEAPPPPPGQGPQPAPRVPPPSQPRSQPSPAAKNSAGDGYKFISKGEFLNILSKMQSPSIKGTKKPLNGEVKLELGLTNAESQFLALSPNKRDEMVKMFRSGALQMPVVKYYQEYRKYEMVNPDIDLPILRLMSTLANLFGLKDDVIPIWVVNPNDVKGGLWSRFRSGYEAGKSTADRIVRNPLLSPGR